MSNKDQIYKITKKAKQHVNTIKEYNLICNRLKYRRHIIAEFLFGYYNNMDYCEH